MLLLTYYCHSMIEFRFYMKSITLLLLQICLGACQQNKIETSQSSVPEITMFSLKTGVNENSFLNKSDQFQKGFLQNQKGFKKDI